MKKLGFKTVIFVFLLAITNGIQGQTSQTQLDPIKLIQQYCCNWQLVLNKDTTEIIENRIDGNIVIDNVYFMIKGTKYLSHVNLYSYSPEEKIFYGLTAMQSGFHGTFKASFDEDNRFVINTMQDFNPNHPFMKVVAYCDSPNSMIITVFDATGVKKEENKFSKIK